MYVYFLHLIFACLKLCMYGDGILEVYILFHLIYTTDLNVLYMYSLKECINTGVWTDGLVRLTFDRSFLLLSGVGSLRAVRWHTDVRSRDTVLQELDFLSIHQRTVKRPHA